MAIGSWDQVVDRQALRSAMEIGFATGPVVSKSNAVSPEQKRKHKHAWRQSQHDAKKHGLNRRHRRPQRVRLRGPCRPISLITLGAHRGVNVAAVALLPRNPLPVAAVPVFPRRTARQSN